MLKRTGGPQARVYQKPKSPVQAACAKERPWVMEFEPNQTLDLDPLMGWTGSRSPMTQVKLSFPTLRAATAFANAHGVQCAFGEPRAKKAPAAPPTPKRPVGMMMIKVRDLSSAAPAADAPPAPGKAA